ncbi:MAG: response regulator, partial [Deltaproteobacteria bacterium]|nr:response regulator [Deltaproteobacteria bacterium]
SNATQSHQVVMNLVTNAAHSMREKGGVIEVDLREVDLDLDAVLLMPDLKPGRYVGLSVRDTGHGMEPPVLESIFDPYFTTKAPGEGTGLGLSVVQGIVKSQGGHVTVSSEVGKGSLFHVFFPRIADLEKQAEDAVESPPGGNERILLIDDEATLVDVVKESLEALGYSAVAKTSSVEALELFHAHPQQFDLVITDQTMPVMTGMVLARKLLEIRPDIPIILCTGYSEYISEEQSKSMGIREFIMKPYGTKDMAKTIRRVLDEG